MTPIDDHARSVAGLASVRQGIDYWAAATPDRVAITDGQVAVTYADLLSRVTRRAQAARWALREARPGALLPVLVDRSVESCISLLACDYARVPFFPLDGHAPSGLLTELLARPQRCGWALSHPGLASVDLPSGTLALTDDHSPGAALTESWGRGADDDRGMVVFTSGSTGRPKGVAFDWATRDARWRRRLGEPRSRSDGAHAVTILPFDSAWGIDVVASTAVGYSLLVVNAPRMRPADLVGAMADFGATHMDVPPQVLRLIAQLPNLDTLSLPDIEFIRVGSELLRYEYLDGIRRIVPPDTTVEHAYGASECGWIFRHRFPVRAAPELGAVPVGRPVYADTVRLDPLPGGEPHLRQVLAAGAVALGYLDDPRQTADRFEQQPGGQRWWRSGDLVSVDPDGMMWHQGRMDDVVKVGGRLASPSQVVTELMRVPGIRQAVVLPVERGHNVRLVAHVELEPGSVLSREEVRQALDRALPSYLVPSAVIRHRTLPTNARGKVDRQQLLDDPTEPW